MRMALLIGIAVLAGCANLGDPQQVAARECKVHPLETARIAGGSRDSGLAQKAAVADLGTSNYRRAQLNRPMGATGTIEEALRDCP